MENTEPIEFFDNEPIEEPNFDVIASWDEAPIMATEADEVLFWERARPSLQLMESSVAVKSSSTESVTISLRVDSKMLARMKRVARSRYLNYQSMIKQWLAERLENEAKDL